MSGRPSGRSAGRVAAIPLLAAGSIWLLASLLVSAPVAGQSGNDQFETLDQAAEFLRTAEIVDIVPVGRGTTDPDRVIMELDGKRASAIFHDVDKRDRNVRIGDEVFRVFYDTYMAECAAYELSRLLQLNGVPPTVLRSVNGREGSLQLWIDDAMTEEERERDSKRPPDMAEFRKRFALMRLFDNLIFNDDRNAGNILVGPDWTVWLIDHTRGFQRPDRLRDPGRITLVERSLWERLRSVEDAAIEAAVSEFLDEQQVEALIKRRALLVEHVEAMIAQRGEGAVLYDETAPQ